MIPGLEKAEFLRCGSMHRNTYINSPLVLNSYLQFRDRPRLFLAGQLTGVEGYIESTAMGLLAGINALRLLHGENMLLPPETTALGSLIKYITETEPLRFQPSNIHFGLFPKIDGKKVPKKEKKGVIVERAMKDMQEWSIIK